MKRTLTNTSIGDHVTTRKRYLLVLEDDPSGNTPGQRQASMFRFLQTLCDTQTLMMCGLVYPERFAVFHNGESWVLQAEAEVEEP
jgi:hypothetical protein